MLIRIENQALENTQKLLREQNFSLSNLDKWAIAQSSLLFHQQGVINLDKVETAITRLDKYDLNDQFRQAEFEWKERQRQLTDCEFLSMDVELQCMKNHDADDVFFMAKFTGGGDGINIKPLSKLSEQDASVVASALVEVKQIYIDAPTSQSLEGYAAAYDETIDLFEQWLPKHLHDASPEKIYAHYQKHEDKFYEVAEDSMMGFYDEVVDDFISRREPMPKWFDLLVSGTATPSPWDAMDNLEKRVNRVQHPQARQFVKEVIKQTRQFLRHFDSLSAWEYFNSNTDEYRQYLETDDLSIELGFMLVWGVEGYWWDVCASIHNMMMEAGETPSHYQKADGEENRKVIPLVYERLSIGESLFHKLTELTSALDLREVA